MSDSASLGRIGVIMGGCSSEREISFKSGRAVVKALAEAGCEVVAVELESCEEETVLAQLKTARIDVAFIALHGEFGEDGGIQGLLEQAGIPYTGSDAKSSRVTISKVMTQERLFGAGLLVPAHCVMVAGKNIPGEDVLCHLKGLPVVVKPSCEGSSIGITIVREKGKLKEAIELAFSYGDEVLVEQYIAGRELTAGILDGRALPLVEIRPKKAFFDYDAKYQKGMTEYIVPAEVPETIAKRIQQAAVQAYQVLGCRDLSRIDFILDEKGDAYLLEINTIPGFTETSLLPKAARQAGIGFGELCLRIVGLALARKSAGCGA